MGVLWSLGIRVAWYLMKYDEKQLQTEFVANQTSCLYQDHVGNVTKNSMVHNGEISQRHTLGFSWILSRFRSNDGISGK